MAQIVLPFPSKRSATGGNHGRPIHTREPRAGTHSPQQASQQGQRLPGRDSLEPLCLEPFRHLLVAGDIEKGLCDRQRRAQLMGRVGCESLLLGEVRLEPREHGVEGVGEFTELIRAAQ